MSTRNQFWHDVEESLGGPVSDELYERSFDHALEQHYVEAMESGQREGQKKAVTEQVAYVREELAKFAPFTTGALLPMRRQARNKSEPPDHQADRERAVVTLSAAEQHRSWIFQREIAGIASELYGHHVERFRQDALSGLPLSVNDAMRWLRSPLSAFQSRFLIHAGGRSPLTTPAVVVSRDREYLHKQWQDRVVIDIGGQVVTCWRPLKQPAMSFNLPGGDQLEFWKNSLVGELVRQGARLARGLPWTDGAAAWFILTGVVPAIPPLEAEFTRVSQHGEWRRGVLKIEVEPWVSEDTLLAMYRDIRGLVMREPARLPVRAVAAWQFMADRLAGPGKQPSYAECCRQWNKEHPDQPYGDYRQFRKDVLRGELNASVATRVASPSYRLRSDSNADPVAENAPSDDRNPDRKRRERQQLPTYGLGSV